MPKIQAGRTDNTRVDEDPSLLQFARVLIVVAGVWHVLIGFAAVQKDMVFVSSPDYSYAVDLTTSGWIHILLGVAFGATGFALRRNRPRVRALGIVLTCMSLIANFLFIPRHPTWSILIILLSLLVMWILGTVDEKAHSA
jgi:O-antigen/teichoic acid export membrane protein